MKLLLVLLISLISGFECPVPKPPKRLRCYYCLDKCETNASIDDCALGPSTFSCISSYTVIDDVVSENKGCVDDEDLDTRDSCDELDKLDGSSCYICSTDLCNSSSINRPVHLAILMLSILSKCFY